MIDMITTIKPKSDQLNADDLTGTTKTIKITKVSILGEAEQPIGINFEGDNNKPYKPCKSMRRVLVNVWGSDGNAYVGRSLTLYRDDKVMFGGVAVGGIRISHMSHLDKDVTMALTATKASRKPYTVKPLLDESVELKNKLTLAANSGLVKLQEAWAKLTPAEQKVAAPFKPELKKIADEFDKQQPEPEGIF